MSARVVVDGLESAPFEVLVGVKQGCVLGPVIFILFLVAVTLLFRDGISVNDGILFSHCLDGNLFNLRRLKANSKVTEASVLELQYADDAALPSHTTTGLQRNLDVLADAYRRAGLNVHTRNTAILSCLSHSTAETRLSFSAHGNVISEVGQFTYLGSILSSECDNKPPQALAA